MPISPVPAPVVSPRPPAKASRSQATYFGTSPRARASHTRVGMRVGDVGVVGYDYRARWEHMQVTAQLSASARLGMLLERPKRCGSQFGARPKRRTAAEASAALARRCLASA